MKRVHLVISGDVIGVGFRAWVQHYARDKFLTGWVKNREDKSVEVVAEGPQGKLSEFVRDCHHGPEVSWVEHVRTEWQKGTGEFIYFEVLY